jgi:hypothetical protein
MDNQQVSEDDGVLTRPKRVKEEKVKPKEEIIDKRKLERTEKQKEAFRKAKETRMANLENRKKAILEGIKAEMNSSKKLLKEENYINKLKNKMELPSPSYDKKNYISDDEDEDTEIEEEIIVMKKPKPKKKKKVVKKIIMQESDSEEEEEEEIEYIKPQSRQTKTQQNKISKRYSGEPEYKAEPKPIQRFYFCD